LNSLSQIDLEKHFRYFSWNKAKSDIVENPEEMIERHYAESLFLGFISQPAVSIVDVGSGGGFPGIPVGILRPECGWRSWNPARRFLREASRDLPNVAVSTDRIEAVTVTFDWSISRAVRFEDVEKQLCYVRTPPLLEAPPKLPVSRGTSHTPAVGRTAVFVDWNFFVHVKQL
jgi:hypothetical protein